jgi:hypothetical protein
MTRRHRLDFEIQAERGGYALVKLDNCNIITKVSRQQLQEALKTISIKVGKLVKKAVSTQRFYDPV